MEDLARSTNLDLNLAFNKVADAFKTIFRCISGASKKIKILLLVAILCPCLAATTAIIVMANIRYVQVVENGTAKTFSTFSSDPKLILKKNGIAFSQYDKIAFSGYKDNAGTIILYPAFKVNVTADNKTVGIMIATGTTADALKEAAVTLNPDDIVSVPLDSKLQADENITVQRVTYSTKISYKPVAFSTTAVTTPQLKKGVQQTLREGKNGQSKIETKVKYIDGNDTEESVTSVTISTNPISKQVLTGTAANTPYSKLTSSMLKLNAQGVPINYSRVIKGRATAYTARRGALTSSGRRAGVGYVAVNPSLIPYGTKLYIMTPGGSYVYGVAVSADTGEFVHDGSGVTTDLYFANMRDCINFAERTVNIYVLD